ncbi:MAG TPA: MaoC family dehydratase N-terminal domain-containing protein [Ktedonobacterales bacterium]|nr:MaoC family dehydratase N-terminal domain-containing protein [Ktedonobacterales bacterium]
MPVDPSLAGHVSQPQTGVIEPDAIRQFAEVIGDDNAVYRDVAAARAAGYANIPAQPTFVTRFRTSFADAGLDPEHSQLLHGEQEYSYTRPLVAGDSLVARQAVASVRQASRGGMAIMTLEQWLDDASGQRVGLGKAIVIVRDVEPGAASAGGSTGGKPVADPEGDRIPSLTKHVTQEQINAYADVSGDHNPIHINPEMARSVGLDGTIAHGMLNMAFLGQLLTNWLATQPERGGWVTRLRVRFQAMVKPGDAITCSGALGPITDGVQRLELWINNQRGERVITGDADVTFAR